jgi:hypothetical protein
LHIFEGRLLWSEEAGRISLGILAALLSISAFEASISSYIYWPEVDKTRVDNMTGMIMKENVGVGSSNFVVMA